MDDENVKNAKQAADMALLQTKAKEFQDKANAQQNKIYQGTFQGITIAMKGSHEVIEVRIDQSFYETSGKGPMEIAILRCLTNLNHAIDEDVKAIQEELQTQINILRQNHGSY